MNESAGTVLCLLTVPFAAVNSLHHELARFRLARRWRVHAVNVATSAFFVALASRPGGDSLPWIAARLWLPVAYYWWAYPWAGRTLHLFYPPEFSFDRLLIEWDSRLFGNPSLWFARGKPRWLNEVMNFFYWSYYLYTPVLGVVLFATGEYRRFEAMALAVNIGYAVCYSLYPWFPLWGPRWALADAGLLRRRERVLDGYLFTRFMNRLMWNDTAHKGGAMPSAHSSTCVVFIVWCARIWGLPGALTGGFIGLMMFVSTVYGRYHYVLDVLVGILIGLTAVSVADLLVG